MDLEQQYKQQMAGIKAARPGSAVASTLTGGVKVAPQLTTPTRPKPDFFTDLFNKVGNVANQTGQVAGAVAGAGIDYFKNLAQSAYTGIESLKDMPKVEIQSKLLTDTNRQLEQKQNEIVQAYKSGKMSKENYSQALRELSKGYQDISNESSNLSSGPTPEQRAMGVIDAGTLALSFGKLATMGAKAVGTSILDQGAVKLEQALTKVPAIKDILIRNIPKTAEQLAGESTSQLITRNAKHIAGALLIKKPLFYDMNIGGAQEVYNQIMEGHPDQALASSVWLASQMLSGGPLGALFKGFSWLKNTTGKLAYGRGSFIDEISKQIGDGNSSQIARFLTTLQEKAPGEFQQAEKTFRILQETNLRSAGENVKTAVENVLTHYVQHGYDLKNVTPSMLYKDMKNWADADALLRQTLNSGKVESVLPKDYNKYNVVRWDVTAKKGLAQAVLQAGNSPQAMTEAVYKLADRPGVGWGNNTILLHRIENIIYNSKSAQEAADAIEAISTASVQLKDLPKSVAKQLSKLGYTAAKPFGGRITPSVDYEDTRKIITAAIKGESDVFDLASAPQPQLAFMAGALEKAGLSPRAANEVANRKLAETLTASLDEYGMAKGLGLTGNASEDVVNGGRAILSKLQNYVENKQPFFHLGRSAAITDIRQLTSKEISQALNVGAADAKAIQKAVIDAYTKVPLEFRGMGDRVVDYLYKYNPAHKYYSRIQSALRYTYNPFFRTQESVETSLLSRSSASNLVWNKSRSQLNDGVKVLDESGIFSSSLPGEAAGENIIGRVSANLTQGQKRNLAGLAYRMAESRGLTLEQMVTEHAGEIDDALRVIVQYPRKGLLASPLARTLNVAFFPMRYNAKVTMLAAQVIAKQPPSVQLAVINSIFQFKDWLKSDEGIRWQAQNADALQVFNWLTPLGNVESAFKLLGGVNAWGDLGSLGGLPLGVITQMMDSQGIINLNTPYVEPKTGDVFPKYIPETLKAKAAVALGDVLGSMFTYPGRTLGLPGKAQTIRDLVKDFIATNGEDFDKRIQTENLTELQKNYIRVLKGDTSDEAIDRLYQSPLEGGFNGYTIPPLALPIRGLVEPLKTPQKRTGLPSGKRAKQANKTKNYALPIPTR